MKMLVESPENHEVPHAQVEGLDDKRKAVSIELDKILASSFFRSAARSRQFLKYVVEHHLTGHPEQLKERTIGTEVFLRPAGYATGDDPVVRVQAGEVRRRLEQYYLANPSGSLVRIELPVGSYSPAFHWPSDEAKTETPDIPSPELEFHPRSHNKFWAITAICLLLALAVGVVSFAVHRALRQKSVLEQFWSPIFVSQQPVLICLAKPVLYRPTQEIYHQYSETHPGTFQTEVERSEQPLPLSGDQNLTWHDIYVATDYGVALGDVYAAVSLSAFLGQIGKPRQVRIGTNYSFEDLRNSPDVLVGAFNNKWTMQLTSNLHFTFAEENEDFWIREELPGHRTWRIRQGAHGEVIEDFAIVSRLLDSKTGQFTITAAGIGGTGTQAAAEFLSNSEYMEEALRSAPAGWQTKNMELVLETTVTDSVPGPPRAVASYYW
jgi:hypothetical protein